MKTKEESDPLWQLTETLFELSHMYGSHTQKKLTGESLLYCEQITRFSIQLLERIRTRKPSLAGYLIVDLTKLSINTAHIVY